MWETMRHQERDWHSLNLRERFTLAGGMTVFWIGFVVLTLVHEHVRGTAFLLAFLVWFLLWVVGLSYLAAGFLASARRRRAAERRRAGT